MAMPTKVPGTVGSVRTVATQKALGAAKVRSHFSAPLMVRIWALNCQIARLSKEVINRDISCIALFLFVFTPVATPSTSPSW